MRSAAALVLSLTLALTAARPAIGAPAPAAGTPAATSDTLRLSLDDAVRIALDQGIDMQIANAESRIAAGRIRETAADAWPQLTGAVDYTRQFDSIFSGATGAGSDSVFGPLLANSPFAAEKTWKVDVIGTQTLYSRKVGAGVGAARAYRKQTEANRQETAAAVALRVKQAYLTASAAGHLVEIASAGRDQAQAHWKQVQLFRRAGTRAEYDLIQAQVDAMNAEPPVVSALNDHELAMLDLKRALGVNLRQPVVLVTPLRAADGTVPVPDDPSLAPMQRAALTSADAEVEGREKLLDVERATRWPELKLSGLVSHQAFPTGEFPARDQFRRSIQGTARLEFPLFLGLKSFGAIQRATAEVLKAEVRREELRQQLDLDIERARQDVRRTLALLLARRGTVDLARRAHHLANVRYTNGISTQLEVTDARFQMMTSEGNEVIAARDYLYALAQLERALGRPVPVTRRAVDEISLTTPNEAAPR